MTIDRSGAYWTGSDAADLDEYLRALTAENHPVDRIVHPRCTCGHERFQLEADADEGCARRACASCRRTHFICDGEEVWSEAEPEAMVCPCDGEVFELAVGFSHRDDGSVRWLTVGERCVSCGVLGAAVNWKIDYAPTDHLYDQV